MNIGTSIALSRNDDGEVLRLQVSWRLQDLPELEAQIPGKAIANSRTRSQPLSEPGCSDLDA
jgi:hypothetical protein